MSNQDKEPGHRGIAFENCSFDGIGLSELIGGSINRIKVKNSVFKNTEQPFGVDAEEVIADGNLIANDPKAGRRRQGVNEKPYAALPAYCWMCKSVFPSANYSIRARSASLWRNSETCPVCGNQHARLSEGVFNLTSDVVQVISAPDFTYDMLARLAEIVGEVRSGRMSLAEAAPHLTDISPSFGAVLQRAMSHPSSSAWSTIVVGVLSAIFSYWLSVKAPNQPQPSPPISFSAQEALTSTLEAMPTLPGPAIVQPQKTGEDTQSAQPSSEKTAPKPKGSHIKKNTRATVNAMRRRTLRHHRMEFGGSRHGGPRC